ncbi:hypothetical protein HWI79_1157 [Cryptosporidium felis]|nr:hypothetical protein HWI79_1157 [Cryptosporidium felis]
MNPYMELQNANNYNRDILAFEEVRDDPGYYDQGEYYDSYDQFQGEDYYNDGGNSIPREEVSCCPMEIIHRRRHSLSYKPNTKKGVKKDVSRIPKFRNPWEFKGDLQPRRTKDLPLSYDEARFIREIWQDTRAQYDPSDGEIEEEFLFEEEYDDLDAEKRRNTLVERGANLVRYSRHYELPTISTIIKSINPEQFRSRSFSPIGNRINKNGNFPITKIRGPNPKNQSCGRERNEFYYGNYNRQNDPDPSYLRQEGGSYTAQQRYVEEYGNKVRGRDFRNTRDNENGKIDEMSFRNNIGEVDYQNESNKDPISLSIPDAPHHRNTVIGIPSELESNLNNSSVITSRRATSPEMLSPTKSTGRGPPPKIGVLEPVETSEGLVSPVNQQRNSLLNTPRMGSLTPRSARGSRSVRNLDDFSNRSNSPEKIPVISPTGKQTIVFHMLPENESNNSKATIFANPDTQNIVTELHITPGVDINVISTPSGPAIEYEISGGRNAKAHINFSNNTAADATMTLGDIPKIQDPREFEDERRHRNNQIRSNSIGRHSYRSQSRSQSRRRSTLDEDNQNPRTFNDEFSTNIRTRIDSSDEYDVSQRVDAKGDLNHPAENKSQLRTPRQVVESNSITQNKLQKNHNSDSIDNNNVDGAVRMFPEFDQNFQNKERSELDPYSGELTRYDENYHDGPPSLGVTKTSTEDRTLQGDLLPEDSNGNISLINGRNESEKYDNSGSSLNKRIHPNPFLLVKKIQQKRSGFSGCIMNTLTCSKTESSELKTFRALNPVDMAGRDSEFY